MEVAMKSRSALGAHLERPVTVGFEESGRGPGVARVARRVIAFVREIRAPEYPVDDLTPHETRLLALIADGHNYKTAAIELGVSVNTVSFHMRRVYEKLHVHSKSQVVAKALRQRLIR